MDSVIPDVNGVNVRVGASLPHAEKKTIKAVHGPTETVIYERIHEAYARRRARPRDRRDAPEYSAPSPAVPRIVANHAFSQTFGQSTSVSMIISPGIYTLCGDKHLGFKGCQSIPHVFTGRAWQLIAGAISQGDSHLPPTVEQRAEASKLCKEISVSLIHTSPEVNTTASLAAHLGGYTDLVAWNQRLVAQTKVLLHRSES
ncbi:MAG: hypothetical protein LQ348_005580 [Seirophora lacunosa]|nr:MAG: hypothetical protein LQ348_005580 [Seirophora lacunosa]